MRGLLLASVLVATAAAGQGVAPGTALLMPPGVVRGSPRVMGLAGAYVGVAEGAEGALRNPAAVANLDPSFPRGVGVDFGFALHLLPPWAVDYQDWDNDGRVDQRLDTPYTYYGLQVLYGVLAFQYRTFGAAVGFDLQNSISQTRPGGFDFLLFHLFGTVGVGLLDDALVLGAGVESTQAVVGYFQDRRLDDTAYYGNQGLTFGALWRPRDQDYRVGLSYWPAVSAPRVRGPAELGGLALPAAVVSPGRLLVGGSMAVWGGGRHFNIGDREGWTPLPQTGEPSPAMTKLLVSVQLDVTLPVANATTLDDFLSQTARPAQPALDRLTFTPRIGLEKEVLPALLRLRLGGFLEPPPVPSGSARLHGTFGFEAYILRILGQKMGLGMSMDLAYQFRNLSITYVFWK